MNVGSAWTPRRQGATVSQGELGTPGRLGDVFETLILAQLVDVDVRSDHLSQVLVGANLGAYFLIKKTTSFFLGWLSVLITQITLSVKML